jgi:hypothetical protein
MALPEEVRRDPTDFAAFKYLESKGWKRCPGCRWVWSRATLCLVPAAGKLRSLDAWCAGLHQSTDALLICRSSCHAWQVMSRLTVPASPCRFYVERNGGCPNMRCRCGAKFHYLGYDWEG